MILFTAISDQTTGPHILRPHDRPPTSQSPVTGSFQSYGLRLYDHLPPHNLRPSNYVRLLEPDHSQPLHVPVTATVFHVCSRRHLSTDNTRSHSCLEQKTSSALRATAADFSVKSNYYLRQVTQKATQNILSIRSQEF